MPHLEQAERVRHERLEASRAAHLAEHARALADPTTRLMYRLTDRGRALPHALLAAEEAPG